MAQYVARRLLLAVPVLVGVSLLVFIMSRVLPGDVYVAPPITAELTVLATIAGIVIAVPLGVVSAAMQGSVADHVARIFGVLGLSVPSYVIGSLTITYLSHWFHWTPPAGGVSLIHDPGRNVQQFLIPAAILGLGFWAALVRLTRSSVLNALHEDYVRTAWAKGLRARLVLWRHVLRNAMIPVLTLAGAQVGYLLGGTVIIESIFSLTGVGSLAFDSINNRDYFILQAVTMLFATVFTLINLAVDLSYAWLDPRIRLS